MQIGIDDDRTPSSLKLVAAKKELRSLIRTKVKKQALCR
jgi:hypothetical protein